MNERRVRILSTGQYLPKQTVTDREIEAKLGLERGWVAQKSGVLVRHFVEDETASLMGAYAAKDALAAANLAIADIDCLICTSGTPEQSIPCTAALVQEHLGAIDVGMPAFDINATCLSFITGFDTISYLIDAGRYRRVLLVATEVCTGLDWNDRESCTLFGDGAAAAILERSTADEGSYILASGMETYSKGAHLTECKGGGNKYHPTAYQHDLASLLFKMDGRGVYRLAAEILPRFVDRLLQSAGIKIADLQMVIPHQASLMAMRLICKQLGIAPEKFATIVQNRGNTVAASVPMALHETIHQQQIRRGDRIMLLGTAAGFSVGGIILEY